MPDERIGAGRDDFLALEGLDTGSRIAVFSEDQIIEVETKHEQRISQGGDNYWHLRPPEPMIQRRQDEQAEGTQQSDNNEDFLRPGLSLRGDLRAPLEEFRVFNTQVEAL